MRSKLIGQSPEYNMLYEILRKTERITQMAPHIGWNNGPTISPEQEIVNTFNTRVEEDGGIFEAEDCLVSRITVLRNLGLWDGASAAWLPHAYKESKLYAVKGGSGVDLGFTRAGTKYRKASTYVEQVPYNLLSQSENWSVAPWATSGSVTVTANAITAPDGTLTADKLTTSGASARSQPVTTLSGQTYTISCWVKAVTPGTSNLFRFLINSGVTSSNMTATSEWQRFEFTAAASSTGSTNNGVIRPTGDLAMDIYVWGIQMVIGSTARDYFPTTDRFNVPSLDYTGATCPVLSVEQARTNLFIRSEEFDNVAWTKSASSVSANSIVGPNGVSAADKLNADTSNSFHGLDSLASISFTLGQAYTLSVYAKAGEYSYLRMAFPSNRFGLGSVGYFNLTTGTIGTTTGLTNSTITSCGNGWYRCSISATATLTGTGNLSFYYVAQSDNQGAYIGSATSGIYIWGAQLVASADLSSYIPTTTGTVARIADSIPVLFPKGTNQVLQSQTFDNAAWTKAQLTTAANDIIAPDGTLTADKFLETATANQTHYTLQAITKPAIRLKYTFSVYIKGINRSWVTLMMSDGAGNTIRQYINISTGTLGSTEHFGTDFTVEDATVTPAANGFYRCSLTGYSNTATTLQVFVATASADLVVTFTGSITSGIHIWGAQLERGDEATTYVVTTTAPVHNGTVIGQTQGSMYFEGSSIADNTNKYITLNNGAANDRISILFSNTNAIVAQVLVGGVSQAAPSAGAFTTGTNYKICVSWTANNVFMYVNGVLAGVVDTSATIPTCNQFVLALNGTTNPFYGNIKSLILYPVALTQVQAAALTA